MIAVVHERNLVLGNGARFSLWARKLTLVVYHVLENLDSSFVEVCPVGHEMASLRNCYVIENTLLTIIASCHISLVLVVVDVVDIAGITPKFVLIWHVKAP